MARQLHVVWPMSFGIKLGSPPWMLLPLAWLDAVMPACNNGAAANLARHTIAGAISNGRLVLLRN